MLAWRQEADTLDVPGMHDGMFCPMPHLVPECVAAVFRYCNCVASVHCLNVYASVSTDAWQLKFIGSWVSQDSRGGNSGEGRGAYTARRIGEDLQEIL